MHRHIPAKSENRRTSLTLSHYMSMTSILWLITIPVTRKTMAKPYSLPVRLECSKTCAMPAFGYFPNQRNPKASNPKTVKTLNPKPENPAYMPLIMFNSRPSRRLQSGPLGLCPNVSQLQYVQIPGITIFSRGSLISPSGNHGNQTWLAGKSAIYG